MTFDSKLDQEVEFRGSSALKLLLTSITILFFVGVYFLIAGRHYINPAKANDSFSAGRLMLIVCFFGLILYYQNNVGIFFKSEYFIIQKSFGLISSCKKIFYKDIVDVRMSNYFHRVIIELRDEDKIKISDNFFLVRTNGNEINREYKPHENINLLKDELKRRMSSV